MFSANTLADLDARMVRNQKLWGSMPHLTDDDLKEELARRDRARRLAAMPPIKTSNPDFEPVQIIIADYFRSIALHNVQAHSAYGVYFGSAHQFFYESVAKTTIEAIYGETGWDWLKSK